MQCKLCILLSHTQGRLDAEGLERQGVCAHELVCAMCHCVLCGTLKEKESDVVDSHFPVNSFQREHHCPWSAQTRWPFSLAEGAVCWTEEMQKEMHSNFSGMKVHSLSSS